MLDPRPGRVDVPRMEASTEHSTADPKPGPSEAHVAKMRQAAFFYLVVALLYMSSVWVLHEAGQVPTRGPISLYMVMGTAIAAAVFLGLWRWRNVWVARFVCVAGAFRVPALLERAFLPDDAANLDPTFYLAALIVVLINLWLMARAGWDL